MSWLAVATRLADRCINRLGNNVRIFDVSGRGILKSPSEIIYDGAVVLTDWEVELPISVWPWVEEGTPIEIDGQDFVAREQSRPNSDGSSVMVPLEPLSGEAPEIVLDGDFL